jgi:Putative Flp pilus-assembly TadE/G-like
MKKRVPDQGVVAVLAVLFILAMGAFLALSFNLGLLMKARGELQTAADSAALAAARDLNGSVAGLASGRLRASLFAGAHFVTGQPVTIDPTADVTYGFWHFGSCGGGGGACNPCAFGGGMCPAGFEPAPDPTGAAFGITAVQVTDGRDGIGGHNAPLAIVFNAFAGNGRPLEVTSRAVAVGPRGRVACALPLGLFDCAGGFVNGGELNCGGGEQSDPPMVLTSDNLAELTWVDFPGKPPGSPDQIVANPATCAGGEATPNFDTGPAAGRDVAAVEPVIDALLGFDEGGGQTGPCLLEQPRTVPVLRCGGGMVIGFVVVRTDSVAMTCADGTPMVLNTCAAVTDLPCAANGGPRAGPGDASITMHALCADPVGATGEPGGRKMYLVR